MENLFTSLDTDNTEEIKGQPWDELDDTDFEEEDILDIIDEEEEDFK